MWSTTFQPVVIAVLVVLEVAVWQVRVALATRGRKRSAAVLGAVNAVLSVAAIGQVVTNLDRLENIAGYAIGVAVGVYVGVLVDARFAGDPVQYRLVLNGDGSGAAAQLRARGWRVTTQPALGPDGPVTVLVLVVRANRAPQVERDLEQLVPDAFRTSIRLRSATPLPLGSSAVTSGPRRPRPTGKRTAGATTTDEVLAGSVQ
jgi:uncharacterized protein YebE (UPF0316 family)